jgi:hypothetical protein
VRANISFLCNFNMLGLGTLRSIPFFIYIQLSFQAFVKEFTKTYSF